MNMRSTTALLFAAGTNLFSNVEVAVQSVGTGERRNLIQGATHPRYAPSGHPTTASNSCGEARNRSPNSSGDARDLVEIADECSSQMAAQTTFSDCSTNWRG